MTTAAHIYTETAQAGTQEWLEATKHLVIVSYVGNRASVPAPVVEQDEPLFGTHIKETVEAFKHIFGKK